MTQNLFANTFMFKDIVPNFESFVDFLNTYTSVDSEDIFNNYTYKYIFNRFCNSNVKYDNEDAFCRHFGITYENCYDQYKKRYELINKLYPLTDEELLLTRQVISNNSLNDNVPSANDPLAEPLDYISSQNASRETMSKVDAYIHAVYKITDNLLEDFLDEFKKHFISIYSIDIPVY